MGGDEAAQSADSGVDPVHRVLPDDERGGEHHQQDQEEDGEAEVLVREHLVDEVCRLVRVLLVARGEARLFQRTVDEAVLGIHDGRLAVAARLLFHACGGGVAVPEDLGRVAQRCDELLHVLVVFEELDGEVAGGILLAQLGVFLQVLLHLPDAVLYLVSVVDVDVAEAGRLVLLALVDGDDLPEKLLHAASAGEHRRHHRRAEQLGEPPDVDVVAALFGLVEHIERADHADVHVDELCGEVEVALQVGRIDDVDDDVRCLVYELFAHIEFLRAVGREAVRAGEVDEVELVAVVCGVAHLRIDRHARVVAHPLVCPGGEVEERCLAAVRVAHECHADGTALAVGGIRQLGRGQLLVAAVSGVGRQGGVAGRTDLCFLQPAGLLLREHFDLVGLAVAQADFIAHDFVFHGVAQGGVEQHLDGLALDESHLDDAFPESAVSQYLHDDAGLAGL